MPLELHKFGLQVGMFLPPVVRERFGEVFAAQDTRLTKLVEETKQAIAEIDADLGLNKKGKGDRILERLNEARTKLLRELANGRLETAVKDAAEEIPTSLNVRTTDISTTLRHREVRDALRAQEPALAAATVKGAVATCRSAYHSLKEAAQELEFIVAARAKAPEDIRGAFADKANAAGEKMRDATAAFDRAERAAKELLVAVADDPLRGIVDMVPEAVLAEAIDSYLRCAYADKFDQLDAAQQALTIYRTNITQAASQISVTLDLPYQIAGAA